MVLLRAGCVDISSGDLRPSHHTHDLRGFSCLSDYIVLGQNYHNTAWVCIFYLIGNIPKEAEVCAWSMPLRLLHTRVHIQHSFWLVLPSQEGDRRSHPLLPTCSQVALLPFLGACCGRTGLSPLGAGWDGLPGIQWTGTYNRYLSFSRSPFIPFKKVEDPFGSNPAFFPSLKEIFRAQLHSLPPPAGFGCPTVTWDFHHLPVKLPINLGIRIRLLFAITRITGSGVQEVKQNLQLTCTDSGMVEVSVLAEAHTSLRGNRTSNTALSP